MIVQEGSPVAVWGKASKFADVSVVLGESVATARADATGKWRVNVDPLPAGGPYEMTIRTGDEVLKLSDVMAGQVWFCSGQSNMAMELSKTAEGGAAVQSDPLLRVFTAARRSSANPEADLSARKFGGKPWIETLPKTAPEFSALAYYFGKAIREATGQPVGMIVSAVGGTQIDSWTDRQTLESSPELRGILERWEQHVKSLPALEAEHAEKMSGWKADSDKARAGGLPVPRPPAPPAKPGEKNSPMANYNAMLHPLIPYTIRGFLWYQGESDAVDGRVSLYGKHFPIFIRRIRQLWGNEALPFYFVQIASYGPPARPGGAGGPLREAQRQALSLPHTGMAVTIDIGDEKDIHPKNKKDAALRLARHALANEYGRPLITDGPIVKSARQSGNSIVVGFRNAEGLHTRGEAAPGQFEVAGETGEFVPVEGRIAGDQVILSWPGPGDAKAVRYAWAGNPVANLYNGEMLPASPFEQALDPGE